MRLREEQNDGGENAIATALFCLKNILLSHLEEMVPFSLKQLSALVCFRLKTTHYSTRGSLSFTLKRLKKSAVRILNTCAFVQHDAFSEVLRFEKLSKVFFFITTFDSFKPTTHQAILFADRGDWRIKLRSVSQALV